MRKFLLCIALGLFLLLGSCAEPSASSPRENKNYGEIYALALDSTIPIDPALNSDMKYIAIDTKTIKDAADEDRAKVLKYFEKYGVNVIDESFEGLKSKGMVKEGNYIEGILLAVKSLTFTSDTEVVVESSKFRSGLGAIGVRSIIKFKNGKWILEKAEMTWIS